jgi:geranylgeranyl diphosphate synthase type II
VRPRLCLATAAACGQGGSELAAAAAAAIELLHCASLVHDDLPCFDDAPTRRGRASVHWAYGESLAVLAGDALIVLAFQTLGLAGGQSPKRMAEVLGVVAKGVGMPFGIVAGQAWESESRVSLTAYQRAKTGALFVAATAGGALAAGADPKPWVALGEWLGEAYQVADDIGDAVADDEAEMGKPIRQDTALGRPNAVRELGVEGALKRLRSLAEEAIAAIPACPGADALEAIIRGESKRLVPRSLAVYAA